MFRNRYDDDLVATGLDLPEDNVDGKRDRTAGGFGTTIQQPLPVEIAGTVFHDTNLDLDQSNGGNGNCRRPTLAMATNGRRISVYRLRNNN